MSRHMTLQEILPPNSFSVKAMMYCLQSTLIPRIFTRILSSATATEIPERHFGGMKPSCGKCRNTSEKNVRVSDCSIPCGNRFTASAVTGCARPSENHKWKRKAQKHSSPSCGRSLRLSAPIRATIRLTMLSTHCGSITMSSAVSAETRSHTVIRSTKIEAVSPFPCEEKNWATAIQ